MHSHRHGIHTDLPVQKQVSVIMKALSVSHLCYKSHADCYFTFFPCAVSVLIYQVAGQVLFTSAHDEPSIPASSSLPSLSYNSHIILASRI